MTLQGRKLEIADRKRIVRLLYDCKTLGRPIGIRSRVLGPKMRICNVKSVLLTDEIMVVLKPYDSTGEIIGTNILRMDDIKSVSRI